MTLRRFWIALALAFVLGACGDDDSTSSDGKSGSGASGGSSGSLSSSGSGGTSSVNTGGGTGGISGAGAGGAGTGVGGMTGGSGGFMMGGRGGFGGMGGSGGSAGTFMMAMCPTAMPQDGSACMGRRLNCMFGDVQCLCRFGMWSCDSSPGSDMDGGTP
jgi:hypothetical protein